MNTFKRCDGGCGVVTQDPCVFCDIIAETEPATFVRRWTDAVAIVPLNPVTPGHVLVIPRAHVVDASDRPHVAALAMERAASIAVPPFNIITSAGREATQSVFHLHVHVIPRTAHDGLGLPWREAEPRRGDQIEGWLKRKRDEWAADADHFPSAGIASGAVDDLLDAYRLHADCGVPLSEPTPSDGGRDDD